MEQKSINFYTSHVDEMLKQAHAEDNLSLLSVLYTLRGSLKEDDISLLSHYVYLYTKEKVKYQQN